MLSVVISIVDTLDPEGKQASLPTVSCLVTVPVFESCSCLTSRDFYMYPAFGEKGTGTVKNTFSAFTAFVAAVC